MGVVLLSLLLASSHLEILYMRKDAHVYAHKEWWFDLEITNRKWLDANVFPGTEKNVWSSQGSSMAEEQFEMEIIAKSSLLEVMQKQ